MWFCLKTLFLPSKCYASSWLPPFDTAERWHIKYIHTIFLKVPLIFVLQEGKGDHLLYWTREMVGYTEHTSLPSTCTIREWGSCTQTCTGFSCFGFCSFHVPFLKAKNGLWQEEGQNHKSWVTTFSGPSACWKLVSRIATLVLLKYQLSLSGEHDGVGTVPLKLPIRPFQLCTECAPRHSSLSFAIAEQAV